MTRVTRVSLPPPLREIFYFLEPGGRGQPERDGRRHLLTSWVGGITTGDYKTIENSSDVKSRFGRCGLHFEEDLRGNIPNIPSECLSEGGSYRLFCKNDF